MTHRDYLFSLERFGIKLGLDQIRALLGRLDHPERHGRTIVVAGTNGKGSVAAMVERGLRAAGYRTGRYTSPHLVRLEERFAIDGQEVTEATLEEAAGRVRAAAGHLAHPPSYFEATTAAALLMFRDAGVEVSVLEVGLGGRLDATNVTMPTAVAITQIARDHEAILGDSLDAIAREKAGVIRAGAIVVAGANPPGVMAVIAAAASAAGASLVDAAAGVTTHATMEDGRMGLELTTPRRTYAPLQLALRGRHQIDNAVVAVRLLETWPDRRADDGGAGLPIAAIRLAVEDATWPGRLDLRMWRGRPILVDGAHNPAGAAALVAYLGEAYGRRLPMVVAMLNDKDVDAMIAALAPAASAFVFTAPASSRVVPPAELARRAAALVPEVPSRAADRPVDALAEAAELGEPVVVAGSLYLAGAVIADLA